MGQSGDIVMWTERVLNAPDVADALFDATALDRVLSVIKNLEPDREWMLHQSDEEADAAWEKVEVGKAQQRSSAYIRGPHKHWLSRALNNGRFGRV